MGYALRSSDSTSDGAWRVVLIDDHGCCCGTLPCSCKTEAEAREYAKAYLRLYSS